MEGEMGKNHELKQMDECFERLRLLSSELSARVQRVDNEDCTNDELARALTYCEVAASLRSTVLEFMPRLEPRQDIAGKTPGRIERAANFMIGAIIAD
jgi:hypothetical protein